MDKDEFSFPLLSSFGFAAVTRRLSNRNKGSNVNEDSSFKHLNKNNNKIGQTSSDELEKKKKKHPHAASLVAFLLGILAVVLSGVCSWYWYDWPWFISIPALLSGVMSLTCMEYPERAIVWASISASLSVVSLSWTISAIVLCYEFCPCRFFAEKKQMYRQMEYRARTTEGESHWYPCVYVNYPPLPATAAEVESDEFCFTSPIKLATYGFFNGFEVDEDCRSPPKGICRRIDWLFNRRNQELRGRWAWKGKNFFGGRGRIRPGDHCRLGSDCEGFPDNKCFGLTVHDSICANGSSQAFGSACNYTQQCSAAEAVKCKLPESCNVEYVTMCSEHICIARTNCGHHHTSPDNPAPHNCRPECSCCGGCEKRGQCVYSGGGSWECRCGFGSFGPHCKYFVDSRNAPGANASQSGMCGYMAGLCENGGKCVASKENLFGFRCQCKEGFDGLYCDNKKRKGTEEKSSTL